MPILCRPCNKHTVTLGSVQRCEYRDQKDPNEDAERNYGWNLNEAPNQHFCSNEDQYRCQARMQVAQPRSDSGEKEIQRPQTENREHGR